MQKIRILVFDEVELLDFAGPLEVFSVAAHLGHGCNLDVRTLGLQPRVSVAKSGMIVEPHEMAGEEGIDLLIIPGGVGTRKIMNDPPALAAVARLIGQATITASVCTGSLVLAKLQYLRGRVAVTHRENIGELLELDPTIRVGEGKRFTEDGNIFTSAGVTAGIDLSLYLVGKFYGTELADRTKAYLEYYSPVD